LILECSIIHLNYKHATLMICQTVSTHPPRWRDVEAPDSDTILLKPGEAIRLIKSADIYIKTCETDDDEEVDEARRQGGAEDMFELLDFPGAMCFCQDPARKGQHVRVRSHKQLLADASTVNLLQHTSNDSVMRMVKLVYCRLQGDLDHILGKGAAFVVFKGGNAMSMLIDAHAPPALKSFLSDSFGTGMSDIDFVVAYGSQEDYRRCHALARRAVASSLCHFRDWMALRRVSADPRGSKTLHIRRPVQHERI